MGASLLFTTPPVPTFIDYPPILDTNSIKTTISII